MSETPATNGPGESMFWAMVRKELKHRKVIDEARKSRTADRQHWKSLGVELGDFDFAVRRLLAKDGGEGVIESLRRRKRYLNYLRIEAGTQFHLFDEPAAKKAKNTRLDQAYNGGAAAFILGVEQTENPFNPSADDGQEWLRGWRDAAAEVGAAEKEMSAADNETDEAASGTTPLNPKRGGRGKMAAAGDGESADEPPAHPRKRTAKKRAPVNPDKPKKGKGAKK